MKVICPICKGKGYRINWGGLLCMSIMSPFIYLVERNEDPNDRCLVSKETCYKCNGKGSVIV